jgi:hypothetical protein
MTPMEEAQETARKALDVLDQIKAERRRVWHLIDEGYMPPRKEA